MKSELKTILVQSPTRVDLAGGTLDLWPLYNFVGGATTVNLAIDIMTTVELKERADSQIELFSEDLNLKQTFKNLEECLAEKNEKLRLLQIQLEFWKPTQGLSLRTKSESPVGAGIGASSSLTVSLLKAFDLLVNGLKSDKFPQLANGNYQNHIKKSRFASVHELVNVAHNLEAQVLSTPTGTQDYYPAVTGGINILTYSAEGIQQEVFPVAGSEIEKYFLLVHTGKAHHSGINNFEVLTKAVNRDPEVLKALHDLKTVAEEAASCCRKAEYLKLPALFQREYAARIKLAKSFSSPEIEKLREVSLQAGAKAVKICGAGGGGCVLVWVSPDQRKDVVAACERNGFKVLLAKPVPPKELQSL